MPSTFSTFIITSSLLSGGQCRLPVYEYFQSTIQATLRLFIRATSVCINNANGTSSTNEAFLRIFSVFSYFVFSH